MNLPLERHSLTAIRFSTASKMSQWVKDKDVEELETAYKALLIKHGLTQEGRRVNWGQKQVRVLKAKGRKKCQNGPEAINCQLPSADGTVEPAP